VIGLAALFAGGSAWLWGWAWPLSWGLPGQAACRCRSVRLKVEVLGAESARRATGLLAWQAEARLSWDPLGLRQQTVTGAGQLFWNAKRQEGCLLIGWLAAPDWLRRIQRKMWRWCRSRFEADARRLSGSQRPARPPQAEAAQRRETSLNSQPNPFPP